ncbi:MAG TPA: hypothetical protein VKY31_00190, partial [Terriglobia bacterium]|nr:hypothetical protein [Terriglobia bacterium]
ATTTVSSNIREITWRHAGIVRSAEGLKAGLKLLDEIDEPSNLLIVSLIIHECALSREESRGAHYREDFPNRYPVKAHSCAKIR